jgi:hypothetical protein
MAGTHIVRTALPSETRLFTTETIVLASSRVCFLLKQYEYMLIQSTIDSTNIVVRNLQCTESHGISVGSLGEIPGVKDIVRNIYVGKLLSAAWSR